MKLSWQVLAALSLVPFGAALAQNTALTPPASAAPLERTFEHQSLIEIAEQGLEHATQSAHELSIAVQNARRNGDMMLVTCLSDSLEAVRTVQAAAVANLGRMNATKTVAEARALAGNLGDASKELHDAMSVAARCRSSAEAEDGETVVSIELDEGGSFGPDADPSVGFPDVAPPSIVSMPPVPPAASPMR